MKLTLSLLTAMILTSMSSAQTLYDFSMRSIDEQNVALSEYKGKAVLIVNVASFCGYTYQYEPLEKLYEKYKDQGLVILAFPANDFGAQEPGTDEEIKEFCSSKFSVTFPLFSKITVKGEDQHPLYKWLVSGDGNDALKGEVRWNFEKFLIDKNGNVVKRYRSGDEPLEDPMISDIEAVLNS